MILITGATGHLGKATIDFLLQKGISPDNISALARSAEKAEELKAKGINIKIGDYDNYASLAEAFKGVDKLLLVSGSDLVKRGEQHKNAINAAKEVGVKHIIYTSVLRKNETETSPIAFLTQQHIETEKLIKATGIPYTLLLNSLYADVLPGFFGEKVLETGVFLPAGNGKATFTARTDMAEATANILITEGHENKEYIIANTENNDLHEVATILGELSGKRVNYLSPSKETYLETVTKAGLPQEYAGIFASFSEAIEQGEFETANTDLENLLGRKPTTIKAFLTQVYSKN
ncbi:MAG: SDR family oxidoreductase [Bacteroidia bacterium]|jgi:NAD(P)H dehydrogenase (quinone)|nr:SDR family oxidoreductase [Bacteroidia bacterium]